MSNRNSRLREKYLNFFREYYEPNQQLIAKDINVNYSYFMKWRKNKLDMTDETLDKVERFLETKMN